MVETSERIRTAAIRVGLVDDHRIVRAGLKDFLSALGDIDVAGEAADGRAAIDLVRKVQLDVLILDIAMPNQSGIDSISMIRAKAPDTGILVLSGHPPEQYAVNLMRHGASGYLNKQCEPGEIADAVRVIAAGRKYIPPVMADLLAQQLSSTLAKPLHESLTDREFQIFLKLARGFTADRIGKELSLSAKTISSYRCRLMDKLDLVTNSDLTYYAIKHKLIE